MTGGVAFAQPAANIRTLPKGTTPAGAPTSTSINANTQGLDVNCVQGCAGSGGGTTTLQQGTTVTAGRQLVTTTPTALPSIAAKWVVVRSLNTNTQGQFIDIGGSGVTAGAGFALAPGDETPPFFITNVNEIYVVGPTGTLDVIQWIATN